MIGGSGVVDGDGDVDVVDGDGDVDVVDGDLRGDRWGCGIRRWRVVGFTVNPEKKNKKLK